MSSRPDTLEHIVVEFDKPQTIARLVYEVEEAMRERTQEMRVEVSEADRLLRWPLAEKRDWAAHTAFGSAPAAIVAAEHRPMAGLHLLPQGDRIVGVRIIEPFQGSALDLTGADEPFQVLSYAQLAGLVAVDGLRQRQG